jgi:predicted peptidase
MRVGIVMFICFLFIKTYSQSFHREFVSKTYYTLNGDSLEYVILNTQTQKSKELLPVIVWLHGKGERDLPNGRQTKNGLQHLLNTMEKNNYHAIIIAPHCPPNGFWSHYDKYADTITHAPPTVTAQRMFDLLQNEIFKLPHVDQQRVYLTGLSMGGFGVWNWIVNYPGVFAAAVPVCGGGDPRKAAFYENTPVMAFHGLKDKVVNPQFTAQMNNVLKNPQLHYFVYYPETGHDAWNLAYKEDRLVQWLFKQKLIKND